MTLLIEQFPCERAEHAVRTLICVQSKIPFHHEPTRNPKRSRVSPLPRTKNHSGSIRPAIRSICIVSSLVLARGHGSKSPSNAAAMLRQNDGT